MASPRWRHQMETFSVLLAICVGNSPVTAYFPAQRSVTQSFDVFVHLYLNKRLNKQSWGWWFETPSRLLWCHCNVVDRGHHCCKGFNLKKLMRICLSNLQSRLPTNISNKCEMTLWDLLGENWHQILLCKFHTYATVCEYAFRYHTYLCPWLWFHVVPSMASAVWSHDVSRNRKCIWKCCRWDGATFVSALKVKNTYLAVCSVWMSKLGVWRSKNHALLPYNECTLSKIGE